jgi:outer membrane cobalamin receptor
VRLLVGIPSEGGPNSFGAGKVFTNTGGVSNMKTRYRLTAALPKALFVAVTMVLTGAVSVAAQEGVITGEIVAATSGQALNGVQVTLEGTGFGGLTNANGRYLITRVPVGTYTVTALNVGYGSVSQEVTVTAGGTSVADFRMEVSAIDLDEIVVTGTAGAVERRKIGVALGSIDVSDIQETTPIDGFSQVLEGRIPGVRSVGTVGGVGASRELRIRGTDSFSLGQRPVIYIDGIRVDSRGSEWGGMGAATCCAFSGGAGEDRLSDLNPDEIDRVEVLKGPAAATLYGSEASGGVIQIFTKRGRSNSPANFSFTSTLGFNRHRENFPTSLRTNITTPDGFKPLEPNRDLIENGLINSYDLTVDGGGEEVTYFVSGGFSYEEGSIKPNDQKRGNLRVNLNWTAAENLTIGVTSGYVRNRIQSLQSGNNWLGIYTNALLSNPLNATPEEPYGGWLDVSVEDSQAISTFSDTDRWTGAVTLQYNPTPNFTHKATMGLDAVNDQKTRDLPFGRHYTYIGKNGERNIGYRNARKFTGDYLGNYDYDDLLGISGSFAFGAQGYWDITSTSMATGKDFAGEGVTTVGGAARTFGGENFAEEVNVGAFAQNRFDLGDLFVTAAVRVDGNSAFGENYGFQVYPKADAAYNVPVDALPGTFSNLKLRAAIGMAGKAPGAFDQFQTYTPNTVLEDLAGVSPNNPGNADLEPENKLEYELGMDVGLFDNRVGIDFTYWNAKTQNALLGIALPPSEGFSSSQLRNVGEILNKGIELSINTTVLDQSSLRWNLGANYEWNYNEILDLGETATLDSVPIYDGINADGTENLVRWEVTKRLGGNWVGYPIGEIIGRNVLGFNPATGKHVRSTYSFYQGNFSPDHMGSVFTDLAIGQSLRVSAQIRGEWGASFSNSDRSYGTRQLAYDEYLQTLDAQGNTTFASDSVLDRMRLASPVDSRDHIRLQEVSLSYTLPETFTGWLGLQRSTLTLAGYNLMWWDDCNCPDPNQNYQGGTSFGNSAFLGLPQPRRFLLSFKTRF